MKNKEHTMKLLYKIALVLALIFVMLFFLASRYFNYKQKQKEIHSRYTYTVNVSDVESKNITKVATKWLEGFTGQFVGLYTARTKRLRNIELETPEIVDYNNNIVLLRFSAEIVDGSSDFFSPWNGVMTDGRLNIEWVVTFGMTDEGNDGLTAYVSSSVSPEEYGIEQYNASSKNNLSGSENVSNLKNESTLYQYKIENGTLHVSFDGGSHYESVPVSDENLMYEESDEASTTKKELQEGSYCINSYYAAFVVGGNNQSGTKTPVTVVYSSDGGDSWVTSTVEKIYDADYYYINFFDDKEGVLVVGYGKSDTRESSRIYSTSDGGETWSSVGSGPANYIIKGVMYTDINNGFFAYDYVDGMDSNLYRTTDGGKAFSKVIFDEQQLDSTTGNGEDDSTTSKLTWSSVYKEALVPILDTGNTIIVYLTQGNGGVYNNGKTAAKFQSVDGGNNWKYLGQVEITT